MAGKDLREAADKIKKRREILKQPVIPIPDAPENIRLSKADFIAKRRKEKEDAVKVEAFKQSLKGGNDGVQEEEGEKEVKRGRPKKVE